MMDYGSYKKIAEKYVIDNKGTLDGLKIYDEDFEEKVYNYMRNLILKKYNHSESETQQLMNTYKSYWQRFIREYRA